MCFKSKRGNEQGTVGAAEMIELHSLGASNPLAIQQVAQVRTDEVVKLYPWPLVFITKSDNCHMYLKYL